MEIAYIRRGKQIPIVVVLYTADKKIRQPVRGVHIVTPSALVTSILFKVKEILYIQMPRLDISASCSGSFAALIHGDKSIVINLKPRNQARRLAISTFNVRVSGSKISNIKT